MRDFRDAKAMGGALRKALEARGTSITHSDSLELISNAFGFDNWNILSAKIDAATQPPAPEEKRDQLTLSCSFCGKSQHQVRKLIAGPTASICDECVPRCETIIEQEDELARLLVDEMSGPNLDELLSTMPNGQLARLERAARSAVTLSERTIRVAQAILSGAALADSSPTGDSPLYVLWKSRPREWLKTQLDAALKRKTDADRIVAETGRALASRSQTGEPG